jgi:hypothetical protein
MAQLHPNVETLSCRVQHAAPCTVARRSLPPAPWRRGLVPADPLRQCMHVIQQKNDFVWPLASEIAGVHRRWHKLGSATWLDGVASFPRGPDEPGVYLVKLTARGKCRIYIGEAANLRNRVRSFGGRRAERPIERGKTTTNMRGRVRRVLRENDGSVEVYLLMLPINSGYHCARIIRPARIAGSCLRGCSSMNATRLPLVRYCVL